MKVSLKEWIQLRGLRQNEIAMVLGMTPSNFCSALNGFTKLSDHRLRAISEMFGIPLDDLIANKLEARDEES